MRSKIQDPRFKIYLTGFMGSGKSTAGPLVARRLHWRFLDLDDVIAERAGRSIPAIFAEEGEDGFRRREAEALRTASREADPAVVATGGGTLAREATMRYALESGTVVYLRVPARVLARRLRHVAAGRPLLQGTGAGDALTARIEELLARRRPFYERAHVTVEAVTGTPEETAARIVEQVRARQL